jgi:trehalose-phosphatase
LPVYIGDDLTDEDAFKALKNTGLTVLVGQPSKTSFASYYLKKPKDVIFFLKRISALRGDHG